ncbi:hypothetical protein [Escherichia coli]|uniref:hypothetical protein n=1 Tax=Escherichia coli TaxID=562 RepID=UPI000DD5B465|nr:hypothetical protein [Escherichia coli]EIT4643653.1 hypothetical protein [Escherichia coli]MDI4463419.1 hypothetical protein [Escherichia coli]
MFKNIANNRNTLLLIIFIFLYIPVLFSRTDMWDGAILDHTISLGRTDVYHEWFSEAGLYLTAFFYDPLAFSKELYPLSAQILTLLFLYLSALEITRLSKEIYNTSVKGSLLVGIFYLLLPLWSTFFSTIYLMHSATIFIALLSARLVICNRYPLLAIMLIPITFQQASMAPLILSIFMLYAIENKFKNLKSILPFSLWIIISFFILRSVFATTGLYSDYNKISIDSIQHVNLWMAFSLSLLICLGPLSIYFILATKKTNKISFSGLVIALIATTIPYIAVGKGPTISDFVNMHGNSMRVLFSCAPILALVLAYVLKYKPLNKPVVIVIMAYMLTLFISAQHAKVNEVMYQRAFIANIKKHPDLNGKVITIITKDNVNFYEYAYLFTKAFGTNKSIILTNKFIPDTVIYKKESYRVKYMQPEMKNMTDPKTIDVTSHMNKTGLLRMYWEYLSNGILPELVTINVR